MSAPFGDSEKSNNYSSSVLHIVTKKCIFLCVCLTNADQELKGTRKFYICDLYEGGIKRCVTDDC